MENEKQLIESCYGCDANELGEIYIVGDLLKIKKYIDSCKIITNEFIQNLQDHLGFKNMDGKDKFGNYIISDDNYRIQFVKGYHPKNFLDIIYIYNKETDACLARILYLKKRHGEKVAEIICYHENGRKHKFKFKGPARSIKRYLTEKNLMSSSSGEEIKKFKLLNDDEFYIWLNKKNQRLILEDQLIPVLKDETIKMIKHLNDDEFYIWVKNIDIDVHCKFIDK